MITVPFWSHTTLDGFCANLSHFAHSTSHTTWSTMHHHGNTFLSSLCTKLKNLEKSIWLLLCLVANESWNRMTVQSPPQWFTAWPCKTIENRHFRISSKPFRLLLFSDEHSTSKKKIKWMMDVTVIMQLARCFDCLVHPFAGLLNAPTEWNTKWNPVMWDDY